MKPFDIDILRAWAESQSRNYDIFLSGTPHPEQAAFDTLAGEFTRLAPCIQIHPSDLDTLVPTFFVADNIGFSALPLEKELPPFLEALSWLGDGPLPPLPDNLQARMAHIQQPCRLTLFIALQCPHCPGMVKTLIPLAARSPKITLEIIDGSLFPDIARKHQVMSAPCLQLDQDFRWTGKTDIKEILTMIIERDPSQLGADTLEQILAQGDAQWICRQMIGTGIVFKGFIDLLLHPTWSVRLGAMVVVEALAAEAPNLAARLCPPLIEAFEDADVTVQGDILYALGEAGHASTRGWIQARLPRLTHPDLVDAANDALDAIDVGHD